jgi:hypothetical protein
MDKTFRTAKLGHCERITLHSRQFHQFLRQGWITEMNSGPYSESWRRDQPEGVDQSALPMHRTRNRPTTEKGAIVSRENGVCVSRFSESPTPRPLFLQGGWVREGVPFLVGDLAMREGMSPYLPPDLTRV